MNILSGALEPLYEKSLESGIWQNIHLPDLRSEVYYKNQWRTDFVTKFDGLYARFFGIQKERGEQGREYVDRFISYANCLPDNMPNAVLVYTFIRGI